MQRSLESMAVRIRSQDTAFPYVSVVGSEQQIVTLEGAESCFSLSVSFSIKCVIALPVSSPSYSETKTCMKNTGHCQPHCETSSTWKPKKGKRDLRCNCKLGDQADEHLFKWASTKVVGVDKGEGTGYLFKNNSSENKKADVPRSLLPVYWKV